MENSEEKEEKSSADIKTENEARKKRRKDFNRLVNELRKGFNEARKQAELERRLRLKREEKGRRAEIVVFRKKRKFVDRTIIRKKDDINKNKETKEDGKTNG